MTSAPLARPTDPLPVAHAALAATAPGTRLSSAGMPDPDLGIGAGGAQRLSNSFIWQTAHAESWTCHALRLDFGAVACDAALEGIAQRSRRYAT